MYSLQCCVHFRYTAKRFSYIFIYTYFLGGSDGKESACNARDTDSLAFMGQEDPLEEDIAAHFSILAWRIPQTDEPGGL